MSIGVQPPYLAEPWIQELGDAEVAAYEPMDVHPLSFDLVHAVMPQLNGLARSRGARCCVIGGAAVMLHLAQRGWTGAPARSSCDLDVAATCQVLPGSPQSLMRCGGMRFPISAKGANLWVDWIVRADVCRQLYLHAIETSVSLGGLRVVAPDVLVAMKLARKAAMRLKDLVDIRILTDAGLADQDRAMEILARLVPSARSAAAIQLERLRAA